jgi:hypothetical protein
LTSVVVSGLTLTGSNGAVACVLGPETVTGSFTVTVQASSTSAFQLNWTASQNSSAMPGTPLDSGSRTLSGSSSYTFTITASFGSIPDKNICNTTFFVAAATATGSDGQSANGSASMEILPD